MRRACLVAIAAAVFWIGAGAPTETRQARATPTYYPERFEWQQRTPDQAGFDRAKLDAAIKLAVSSENPATKDLALDLATTFGREPFDTLIGPVQPRAALNGIVVHHDARAERLHRAGPGGDVPLM